MRRAMVGLLILLAANGVGAAPQHQHAATPAAAKPKCAMCASCAMCREMKGEAAGKPAGKGAQMGMMGMMGGGRMGGGGMMGGKQGQEHPASVTVGPDGSVVVVRGNTLLKYDAALKLVGQVELPAEGAAGHEHH